MLMENDSEARPSDAEAPPTEQISPAPANERPVDDTIDEAKLEAEFGPPPDSPNSDPPATHRPPHKRFWVWLAGLSPARKIIYGLLIVLIIVVGWFVWHETHKPLPKVPSLPVYHAPTANTVPSKLTGLQVDPAINKLQVTGVMIENSVYARPQSSLNQAGVVYEAIAEAGITRFLALFQDTQSNYIGPVRSARPYFVQWCQAFDCALAHVGGSPEALNDIKAWHVKNLDQFFNAGAYHRINSRYAPHNMYTSQAKLTTLEKSKGYTSSSYTGFEHLLKEPKVAKADITTTSISFNYPGSAYDVHYGYDAAKNDYKRFEGGKPHYSVDASGHKVQNTPKVVIALVMPYSIEKDNYHSSYNSIGSGTMYVFQDGSVTKGTWSRAGRAAQFTFSEASGQPIKLVPGQTWISAVAQNSDVSYH